MFTLSVIFGLVAVVFTEGIYIYTYSYSEKLFTRTKCEKTPIVYQV